MLRLGFNFLTFAFRNLPPKLDWHSQNVLISQQQQQQQQQQQPLFTLSRKNKKEEEKETLENNITEGI